MVRKQGVASTLKCYTMYIVGIYYKSFNFVNSAILNALAKIKASIQLNPCIFYVSLVVDIPYNANCSWWKSFVVA